MVRATSAKLGLSAGNVKFHAKMENEYVHVELYD
jgi:hypothetical protein